MDSAVCAASETRTLMKMMKQLCPQHREKKHPLSHAEASMFVVLFWCAFVFIPLILFTCLTSQKLRKLGHPSGSSFCFSRHIVSVGCTIVCHSPYLMWVFGDGSLHTFLNIFHPPISFLPPCTQVDFNP